MCLFADLTSVLWAPIFVFERIACRVDIARTSTSQHIAIFSRRNFSLPSFKLRLSTKTKLSGFLS